MRSYLSFLLIAGSALFIASTLVMFPSEAQPASSPSDAFLSRTREEILMREGWGRERVTEALQLKRPDFRAVFLSSLPTMFPHVCGHVMLQDPHWGPEYRPFIVNGTTGNVAIDDNTLLFSSLWARVCSGRDISHEGR